MRINKFIALATGLSRRAADAAVTEGRVMVNAQPADPGQAVTDSNIVTFDGSQLNVALILHTAAITVLLNKPAGYVVSRNGQGSPTIYDLLPQNYHMLKPVGRLDKDSSGLLLLTNDGRLANELTHPSRQKIKVYEVRLNKPLQPPHHQLISGHGVRLDDGISKIQLDRLHDGNDNDWQVTMHEGRNRQIRRTFAALGYKVIALNRTQFGPYQINKLAAGAVRIVD